MLLRVDAPEFKRVARILNSGASKDRERVQSLPAGVEVTR